MKQALFLINFIEQFKNGYTQEEAMLFAHQVGFTGIELTNLAELRVPDCQIAERLRRTANSLSLDIVCFSMGARLEVDNWMEQVNLLKKYIDVAVALGTPMFHHTFVPTLGYTRSEMPFYKQIKSQLLDAANEVLSYASTRGVTCVYEDQGFVINGILDFEDLYFQLTGSNKGIVSDFGNIFFYGESPAFFTSHFLHEIQHVHVKDYLLKSGGGQFPGKGWYRSKQGDFLRGTIIGHGVIDYVPLFRTLLSGEYKGWYSLEFDGMEDPFIAASLGKENMQYYYDEAIRQQSADEPIRLG